jgi:putative tryptophan/tyrosine transport system substrate-binding protein
MSKMEGSIMQCLNGDTERRLTETLLPAPPFSPVLLPWISPPPRWPCLRLTPPTGSNMVRAGDQCDKVGLHRRGAQMRRREFTALVSSAALWPLASRAQPGKVHTILWVSTEAEPDPFIAGFREGMRALGYVEGRNLMFVVRWAPGNPTALEAMLPELLAIPADLIVSSGPAIRAMRATTDKPVLFAVSGDPIELGVAESLARPGRNFTGSTFLSPEVAQKRVQLVRELLPNLRTLVVLSNANHPGVQSEHDATKKAASALSIRLAYAPFGSPSEIDGALERVCASDADAMLVFPDAVTMVHRAKITAFAMAQRLPSMFGWREYCEAGGLISYGANQRAMYVRLAAYADRLLRGKAPADLPIEQPTKFEVVVNVRTAQAIGLDIPTSLLVRADEVIE